MRSNPSFRFRVFSILAIAGVILFANRHQKEQMDQRRSAAEQSATPATSAPETAAPSPALNDTFNKAAPVDTTLHFPHAAQPVPAHRFN